MTDIRERHVPALHPKDPRLEACGTDWQSWPCDAIREADRADNTDAAYDILYAANVELKARADNAEGMLQECIAESALLDKAMEKSIDKQKQEILKRKAAKKSTMGLDSEEYKSQTSSPRSKITRKTLDKTVKDF